MDPLSKCLTVLASVEDLLDDSVDSNDDELSLLGNDELEAHGLVPVVATDEEMWSCYSAWEGDDLVRVAVSEREYWRLEEKCMEREDSSSSEEEEVQVRPKRDLQWKEFFLPLYRLDGKTGFEDTKNLDLKPSDLIVDKYKVSRVVGKAAFSTAYSCKRLSDGTNVCLKVIKNNKDYFDQSLDEIRLLKVLQEKGGADKVVVLMEYFYFKEHLVIVTELLGDNLYVFVHENYSYFAENVMELLELSRQCLQALEFVHKLSIYHCDVKPENILLVSVKPLHIKLIDFGSSCYSTDHMSSYIQSRFYRAPEVILGCSYDERIDIWSMGCLLSECFTGTVLFEGTSAPGILGKIIGTLGGLPKHMLKTGKFTNRYFLKGEVHTLFEKDPKGGAQLIYSRPNPLHNILAEADPRFLALCTDMLCASHIHRKKASACLHDHIY